MQALGIAWDSRPKGGGQRWFHLYPDEKFERRRPAALDRHRPELELPVRRVPLDRAAQELRRAERTLTRRPGPRSTSPARPATAPARATSPGRRRAQALARAAEPRQRPHRPLRRAARPRRGRSNPATGNARRGAPRDAAREVETCARCHSRRAQFAEDWRPGRPLLQTHLPACSSRPATKPTARMRDEVYNYGSFLQSQMYRGRRLLQRLPRSALAESCAPTATPSARSATCRRRSTQPVAPPPSRRVDGRALRRLPHAGRDLHGIDARRDHCSACRGPTWTAARRRRTPATTATPTATPPGRPRVERWFPQRKGFQTWAETFAADRGEPAAAEHSRP